MDTTKTYRLDDTEACHWLASKPVWRFGRYDFHTAISDPDIGDYLYETLRD